MKDITVKPEMTIRQAMIALDSTAEKCLLVVNEQQNLIGTLTDGDIRRGILNGQIRGGRAKTIFIIGLKIKVRFLI